MDLAEKELLLNQIEHKAGMLKTFYKDEDGASDLIEVYEDAVANGISIKVAKILLEDLTVFLKEMNEKGNHWGRIVKSI